MEIRKLACSAVFGLFFALFPVSINAQDVSEPLIHQCTNGMSIQVTPNSESMSGLVGITFVSDTSRGEPAYLISFRREGEGNKRRYVHGKSSVVFDGVILTLVSPLEFQGSPIGSVECELTGPEEATPIMQGGNAGRYFRLKRAAYPDETGTPRYESIESACFFKVEPLVWAFASEEGEETRMIGYTSDDDQNLERFTVDRLQPHEDKALYRLGLRRSRSSESAVAEFVSPLDRSSELPSATAGLVRLFVPEGRGIWAECHENDNLVFMGHADGANFLISLDGDGLILEIVGLDGDRVGSRIHKGHVSFDKGFFIFNFFDGNTRVRIRVDPKGRAFFNHIQIEGGEGVSFARPPEFYFSANSKILQSIDARLDIETAKFLDDRTDCNTILADDFFHDGEDKQEFILQAVRDLGCHQLEQRKFAALKSAKSHKDVSLIRFLESGPSKGQAE